MCFDQKTSFSFAALGLFLAFYVHRYTSNTKLAVGVFWFFLMEFLQVSFATLLFRCVALVCVVAVLCGIFLFSTLRN
jgi:hypothetical protein